MKYISIIMIIIALISLVGCSTEQKLTDKDDTKIDSDAQLLIDSCTSDSDCICGGIDKNTDRCFMGNKDYYDKYVDKSKDCPDFCTGIEGNLVMKCIDGKCIQMYECLVDKDCNADQMCINNRCTGALQQQAECAGDSGCKVGGCSGQLCVPVSQKERVTTCEFLPEYECYRDIDCGCIDGKCDWKVDAGFAACLDKARS